MDHAYTKYWGDAVEMPENLRGRVRYAMRNVVLDALSILAPASKLREAKGIRCLFCHYVFDDQINDFERILIHLKKIGNFVDTSTALSMISGDKPIDGSYFHLSFDDGLKNNFTNAIPVLLRQQVPCLFFVPSALIGAEWEAARHYCLEVTRYRGVIELANWSDLHQAVGMGFEIGSHSHSHSRLSSISNNATKLTQEISGSKYRIEDKLGVECSAIAWPFGTLNDIDSQCFDAIRKSGYRAAFGNFRASITPGETDLFAIPRHHFEPQWPLRHISYFAKGYWERSL